VSGKGRLSSEGTAGSWFFGVKGKLLRFWASSFPPWLFLTILLSMLCVSQWYPQVERFFAVVQTQGRVGSLRFLRLEAPSLRVFFDFYNKPDFSGSCPPVPWRSFLRSFFFTKCFPCANSPPFALKLYRVATVSFFWVSSGVSLSPEEIVQDVRNTPFLGCVSSRMRWFFPLSQQTSLSFILPSAEGSPSS